jgi:hypothetical protein
MSKTPDIFVVVLLQKLCQEIEFTEARDSAGKL